MNYKTLLVVFVLVLVTNGCPTVGRSETGVDLDPAEKKVNSTKSCSCPGPDPDAVILMEGNKALSLNDPGLTLEKICLQRSELVAVIREARRKCVCKPLCTSDPSGCAVVNFLHCVAFMIGWFFIIGACCAIFSIILNIIQDLRKDCATPTSAAAKPSVQPSGKVPPPLKPTIVKA